MRFRNNAVLKFVVTNRYGKRPGQRSSQGVCLLAPWFIDLCPSLSHLPTCAVRSLCSHPSFVCCQGTEGAPPHHTGCEPFDIGPWIMVRSPCNPRLSFRPIRRHRLMKFFGFGPDSNLRFRNNADLKFVVTNRTNRS